LLSEDEFSGFARISLIFDLMTNSPELVATTVVSLLKDASESVPSGAGISIECSGSGRKGYICPVVTCRSTKALKRFHNST
jgi:hypothetical protein